MKKTLHKLITCSLLSLCCFVVPSKAQKFEWVKQMGSEALETIDDVTLDDSGNVYVTGTFNGNLDVDPGPGVTTISATGDDQTFVAKYTAAGTLVWAQGGMGGRCSYRNNSVAVDAQRNVYVAGSFQGTGPFGTTSLTAMGSRADMFIVKLDANGNYLWVKQVGNNNEEYSWVVKVDPYGKVYIVGNFSGYQSMVDFDPGPGVYNLTASGTNSNSDVFILKLDAAGNFIWARSLGGDGRDEVYAIDFDALGNVYTTGYFGETADFDPGAATYNLTSTGRQEIFISKLDSAGNFVWAKQVGGSGAEKGHGLKVDKWGNIYSTGIYEANLSVPNYAADFDPGPGVYNLFPKGIEGESMYVLKLNAAGNFVWAKGYGSVPNNYGGDGPSDIDVDTAGKVYITGRFRDSLMLDGTTLHALSTLRTGGYIAKLDSNGSTLWATQVGDWSNATGSSLSLIVDKKNNVYTAAPFLDTATFHIGANKQRLIVKGNQSDLFIYKINQLCTDVTNISQQACVSYTLNGTTYTEGGTYQQKYTNAAGCDSTIILTLGINKVDTIVTVNGLLLTAKANGATYQWIDCNTNQLIANATSQSYTGVLGGHYAVIVTQGNCTDTSSCRTLTPVSVAGAVADAFVSVYPNPAYGAINIKTSHTMQYATVSLTNIVGQVLATTEMRNTSRLSIDVQQYAAGTYLLQISEDGHIWHTKVVKQ